MSEISFLNYSELETMDGDVVALDEDKILILGDILTPTDVIYDADYMDKLKKDYKFGPEIGSGYSDNVVIIVKNIFNGGVYTLKIIKNFSLKPDYLNEFKFHLSVSGCTNIARVYKATQTLKAFYILMELVEGKNLYDKLEDVKVFNSRSARYITCQIAKALEFIHKENIVYNDLKLENIIIDDDLNIKLIDFGLSVSSEIESFEMIGTIDYLSPEKISLEKSYNKPSDIWALGVLYYELLIGTSPFRVPNNEKTHEKIVNCDIVFPETMDKNDVDIIKKILLIDPDTRPTARELVDMLG
jgi:serine/threonine protein kinase